MSDQLLTITTTMLHGAKEGSSEAQRRLFEASTHFLRRRLLGLKLTSPLQESDCDDIVQDVELALLKALPTLRLEHGRNSYLNFLSVSLSRAAGAHLRKAENQIVKPVGGTDHHGVVEGFIAELSNPVSVKEEWEHIEDIMQCAGVPPEQVEVLILKYRDGLTTAQIGERIKKKAGTIRQIIARALQKLRTGLRLNPVKTGYRTTRSNLDDPEDAAY